MKYTVTNKNELKSFGRDISKLISQSKDIDIIGIDGVTQSGKSKYIRAELIETLGAELIDIDKLIQIDETSIIYKTENLNLVPGKLYIVDGILNREFLHHYDFAADLNIYVKKMASYGWTERDWLDNEIVSDYGIDESFQRSPINRQIFRYHNEYKPVERADVMVEITEEFVTQDFPKS